MQRLIQSPLDPAFVQNPYAFYAEVFTGDTIRYWQDYDMPAIFDAANVQAVLRNRRFGRALPADRIGPPRPHLAAFDAVEAVSMLDLEPPDHTRLRGLVLRAFTSRRIKALAPDIHDICDRLIADLPKGGCNLIPAFCTALPVRIIARLLGVPAERCGDLLRWSNAMVAMYQAGRTLEIEHAANAAASEFTAFLSDYIDIKRRAPQDDLISHLLLAEENGQKLTRQELIGTCILLLNAGHEATVHTMGNAVKALLEHQTPPQAFTDQNIAATVEEVLRFDPPLHMFTRYSYEDTEIGDHTIRSGQQVALMLGAAGRDPALCKDPDVFDPFRAPVPHAAFGGGLHFCVGAPLARLELQIGLQRLFAARPNLTLSSPPRFANAYHFHGLERLDVTT
ncbi:cytochrome P450 [Roseobacter denitrificans]|nr:cytochrome P450 [Roseobacter denitrificans]AVL51939.1 cytochrome P450 [Roseobacter denitrificans]SFF82399.1 unspecific monooxygenase [Roseobacter denitrificans OCh 114]